MTVSAHKHMEDALAITTPTLPLRLYSSPLSSLSPVRCDDRDGLSLSTTRPNHLCCGYWNLALRAIVRSNPLLVISLGKAVLVFAPSDSLLRVMDDHSFPETIKTK